VHGTYQAMDPLTIAAASGMRSRMESLDMLANNLANAETSGYKADREFYNLFVGPDADAIDPATLPLIENNWTDHSQGVLKATGSQLDFALDGKGFFTAQSPTGPVYTRAGSFHFNAAGALVTADNYPVLGVDGKPLKIDPAQPVEVQADGSITQTGQSAGKFEVVDFDSARELVKRGSTYFTPANATVKPRVAAAAVRQGAVEASNVGSAESAVRLVNVMRQFEMLQKTMQIGAGMNRKAVDEVARVGS
jgi:flagellar basal-body rod protein FlgF